LLPDSLSPTCSTNPSLPSYVLGEKLHGLVSPAPVHPVQISSYHEEPVISNGSLVSDGLFPITASEFQRYERNVSLCVSCFFLADIPSALGHEYTIHLMRSNLSRRLFHGELSVYVPIFTDSFFIILILAM
jgi:hypothetical protein